MEQDDELFPSMDEANLAELFAESITRVEASETIEAILTDAPQTYRAELSEFLGVADQVLNQHQTPLPARNEATRAANRAAFLQAAAQDRAEYLAAQPVAVADPARQNDPTGLWTFGLLSISAWLNRVWARFQQATTIQAYRFAPLAITLMIALIAALSVVSVTQAAVPGDLTYPVKNWARSAGLALTPPDKRPKRSATVNEEVAAEIIASARRNQQSADRIKDLNEIVTETTVTVPFQGFQGNQLLLGGLVVFPSYQPDANHPQRVAMAIDGELTEGALVEVTVKILPGQTEYVQGVRALVLSPAAPPPPTATPQVDANAPGSAATPTAVPVPTRGPRTLPPCTRTRPAGWIPYTVKSGDSISMLAAQRGVAFATVTAANCLTSDLIITGKTLYLPSLPARATPVPPTPTSVPPTATPIPPTATPVPPTATPLPPTATGETTLTPQTPNAATLTPTPASSPTVEGTPTQSTPVETPTTTKETPTVAAPGETTEPTNTPTAEASATPAATETATEVPTAAATATENATPIVTSTEPAAAPTSTPTESPPLATATEIVGATPTTEPAIATAAAPPVEAPTPVSTPVPTSTTAPLPTDGGDVGAGAQMGEPALVQPAPVEPAPVEPTPVEPASVEPPAAPSTEEPAGSGG